MQIGSSMLLENLSSQAVWMFIHIYILPVGNIITSDDFETGTRAAAFGGTTTIIDFAQQSKGHSLNEALEMHG